MSDLQVQQIRELFDSLEGVFSKVELKQMKTAAKFNVFNAAHIGSRELSHSAFIASLLDPKGNHGQKDLFLKAFLKLLSGFNPGDVDLSATHVWTEYSLAGGRIDILLVFANDRKVAIENKVWSGEGHEQLSRYAGALGDGLGKSDGNQLVYLTPDGRAPETIDDKSKVKNLSYGNIAEKWLEEVIAERENIYEPLPDNLLVPLRQYINICKVIGGIMTTDLDSEIGEFLEKPENIKTALLLEPHLPGLRSRLLRKFWVKVRQNISNDLPKNNVHNIWYAHLENGDIEPNNGIEIYQDGIGEKGYHFVIVCTDKRDNRSWLGIRRPKEADKDMEKATLIPLLVGKDYTHKESNPDFPGWRWTIDMIGLERGYYFNPEFLNSICDGNELEAKARKLTDEIIDNFVGFGIFKELEKLNKSLSVQK